MCRINFEVTIPTIQEFLYFATLRTGCIIIIVWTIVRTLFCLLFFMFAMVEIVAKQKLGVVLQPKHKKPAILESSIIPVCFCYMFIMFAEVVLLVYTRYLACGIYCENSSKVKEYLLVRFFTWILELLFLVMLVIFHHNTTIVGFYLGFLILVILEFYSFIVVYSYFWVLKEDEEEEAKNDPNICGASTPPPPTEGP